MAETRASSKDRITSLVPQFNLVFRELSSVVQRPDSLRVGVAGPFDPIEIPDDVKATHATLASQPDSVSVKEIERCIKILTNLSSKRKIDILDTMAAAINADSDARIAAQFAEREEAFAAQMRARDAEYAANMQARDAEYAANMKARDAESAAKFDELIKNFEASQSSRALIRSAGSNGGSAADPTANGGASAGSIADSFQLQAEIGKLASGISLQFIGEMVNSKDEAKLNSLSTIPSAELIQVVRDVCSTMTLQQKEQGLQAIYANASQLYGLPPEIFGSVPLANAVTSHFTAGGALLSRRDIGTEVASRDLNVANLTAIRTLDEATAEQKAMQILLQRGTSGIQSLYDPVNDKRVYSIPHRTEYLLRNRSHFQQLLVKALIIVLEYLVAHRINANLTQEYAQILTFAKEADVKKLFWPEVYWNPTSMSSLFTLVTPNINAGSNLLSLILWTNRDRFHDKDLPRLGDVLSQFLMDDREDPPTCLTRLQALRDQLSEPSPDVGNLV